MFEGWLRSTKRRKNCLAGLDYAVFALGKYISPTYIHTGITPWYCLYIYLFFLLVALSLFYIYLLQSQSIGILPGNRLYSQFCKFGKFVDERFAQLGASRILPLYTACELLGQEKTFLAWDQALRAAYYSFEATAPFHNQKSKVVERRGKRKKCKWTLLLNTKPFDGVGTERDEEKGKQGEKGLPRGGDDDNDYSDSFGWQRPVQCKLLSRKMVIDEGTATVEDPLGKKMFVLEIDTKSKLTYQSGNTRPHSYSSKIPHSYSSKIPHSYSSKILVSPCLFVFLVSPVIPCSPCLSLTLFI